MATIKVACPRCGQKVSGDESFFGTTVECPVCSSAIDFPGQKREGLQQGELKSVPPTHEPEPESPSTPAFRGSEEEAPPQAPQHAVAEPEISEAPPSPIFGAISMVSAVIAVVTCGIAGPLFAPLAIIFGHTALAKARHSPVQPAPGHTLGAIGLMIGYVSLLLTITVLVVLVFFGDSIRSFVLPTDS
ncbi:MAG: hypothetical protein WD342_08205 [Verrucomicrobiales bacterium]